MVRLLQEFGRIESRDPEPWRENITFVCGSLGGCKVGLFPREREGGREEEDGRGNGEDKEEDGKI